MKDYENLKYVLKSIKARSKSSLKYGTTDKCCRPPEAEEG